MNRKYNPSWHVVSTSICWLLLLIIAIDTRPPRKDPWSTCSALDYTTGRVGEGTLLLPSSGPSPILLEDHVGNRN